MKAPRCVSLLVLTCGIAAVAQAQPRQEFKPSSIIRFFVDPATNSEDAEQHRTYGLSVIPPWPEGGWVFINLPEHLEYMPGTRGIARHHDKRKNVWQVSRDGAEATYAVESLTEPGVFFSVKGRVESERALFEMSITNRSTKTLKSIRPLLCFQYHHLRGFPAANSDNFAHTFVLVAGKLVAVADLPVKHPEAYARMAQVKDCVDTHNWWAEEMGGFIEQPLDLALTVLTAATDDRKVIVAWKPGKNLLTNAAIPCIHADPCFGDLLPGQARTVHGELIFTRRSLDRVVSDLKKEPTRGLHNRIRWDPEFGKGNLELGADDVSASAKGGKRQ